MSDPQPNPPRGRARATARGRPPPQPQVRGVEPRRPGDLAASQQATPVGRGRARSVSSSLANLTISNFSSSTGSCSQPQPISRNATRFAAELLHTRPASRSLKQGTEGDPVKLLGNYFRLNTTTNWCLLHYDVKFSHDEDRTIIRKALVKERFRQFGGYLFDGSSLYMTHRIVNGPLEFFATRSFDNEQIKITVTLVADMQPSDPHYIQIFNVCMNNCLKKLDLTLIGRNYYDGAAATHMDGYNLSLWPGYVTSIRHHENSSILMIADITYKVMRKDTALAVAQLCMNQQNGNFRVNYAKAMIGTTVMTLYNDTCYKITEVAYNTTPKDSFEMKDGSRVTYLEYFQKRWNIRIRDANQPLLVAKSKTREMRAGAKESVYLIPELCRMTGLSEDQHSDNAFKRERARITCINPRGRIERLLRFNDRLHSNPAVVQDLRHWNMSLERDLIKIDGRILPACLFPLVDGRSGKYTSNDYADWTSEVRKRPMFISSNLQNWTVVVTRRAKRSAEEFVNLLIKAAQNMNFQIGAPRYEDVAEGRIGEYVAAIDKILSSGPCDLIMTVFPNKKEDRYMAVKKKCYVDRVVASQVVLETSVNSKNAFSIATKVAVQMNCKLGGAPWSVPVRIKGLMVIGFDVYHNPNSKAKSVGAMVASLKNKSQQTTTFSRYYSAVDFHRDGNELSASWEANIANALRAYQSSSGDLPQYIVVYRDGVGDGQVPQVKELEVKCIKKALTRCYGEGREPQFIFIVVSKRIRTRLFTDRRENPRPGTVVDDVITFPHKYDFYLVSQTVRQGTVSPTSYNVIHDESNLTPDDVQKLSYTLTHLYFNWSGTISVPAPCQYAHKLAYMVGETLHTYPSKLMENKNLLYFL